MQRTQRDTLLGLMFFGTLGFLLWATVNLTDLSLSTATPLNVWFPDAGGVRVGDPVLVLGKRIGKVVDVRFHRERQQHRIEVLMRLLEDVPLSGDHKIEIQDSGVLGGKQVQIDPGTGPAAPPGEVLGVTTGNPLQEAGRFFGGQGNSGEKLDAALAEIRDFFRHMNDPDTSIGALVRKRELYDEVLGSVQSMRRLFQSIEAGEGLLGRVIKDSVLRDDAMTFVANLRRTSEQFAKDDNLIGRLLNDRVMAENIAMTLADLQTIVADVRAGEGAIGALLRDPQTAQELRSAVAQLNLVLSRANDPSAGALGQIVANPQMAEDLRIAVGNVRLVTDRLTGTEGTLAILLNDVDLGIRVRRIFTQISRALEDARESAPIANLVQVVFGAL